LKYAFNKLNKTDYQKARQPKNDQISFHLSIVFDDCKLEGTFLVY
jgi:hypothetical protein